MHLQAKRLMQLASSPVLFLGALLAASGAMANPERWQVNLKPGVTELGQEVFDLHMGVFWVCVVIGVLVFGIMAYSVVAFRRSANPEASQFHENTRLEIAWTVVPFLILVGMAYPATKTLIELYDTEEADIDILVTGYQWKWKYEYLNPNGDNVSFFSSLSTDKSEIYNEDPKGSNYLIEVDEPMVIPVNKKVRFLVTANDVLHAWWVPALAVKRDAIPGFINEAWTRADETGVFRGQCAELCGRDHGFMPIVVNVVEEPEYQAWLAEKQAEAAEIKQLMAQTFSMDELMQRGEVVYKRACIACHGANGEGGVGKAITGSPIATGPVKPHIDVLVNGVPGSAMQAFGGQLNDVEMAAIVTFTRNAFGNNMGDRVQPIDIYNFKKGQ